MPRFRVSAISVILSVSALMFLGCGGDNNNPTSAGPTTLKHYDKSDGWSCADAVTCQDVFDIKFSAGSTVTFKATDITGDSVVEVALYAPGDNLGGTNLFTGTANEYRCNYVYGCSSNTAGQTVSNFAINTTGVYRLAITRDWGDSCSNDGTYRLIIDSDKGFTTPKRTVDDVATLAPGTECP